MLPRKREARELICYFYLKCFALSEIQFGDGFDTKKLRKMTSEYREIRGLNIKSFFNRRCPRRRRRIFLTLYCMLGTLSGILQSLMIHLFPQGIEVSL